jgi:hypothetical protein
MSIFKVSTIAINPKNEELSTPPIEALVDTGSELTVFETADGRRIEREVGYSILRVEDYETNDEVVFAQKGDLILLGARTIEGFSVTVDNIGHRFVARASLATTSKA